MVVEIGCVCLVCTVVGSDRYFCVGTCAADVYQGNRTGCLSGCCCCCMAACSYNSLYWRRTWARAPLDFQQYNFFSVNFRAAQSLTATLCFCLFKHILSLWQPSTLCFDAVSFHSCIVVSCRINLLSLSLCLSLSLSLSLCDSSCGSSVTATRTLFSVLFLVILCTTKKFDVVLCPLERDPGDATEVSTFLPRQGQH